MFKTRVVGTALVVAVALLAGTNIAIAQSEKPAEQSASTASAIVVKSIIGKVRFKSNADAAFAELKEGQQLSEGAEIFTGPSSSVQIQVGTGQVFTIDRLGRVVVREAINTGEKDKTTLQLPYGRVKFEVTSTQVANDVKIQAPDATLAVKGTIGIMEVIPGQETRGYGGDLNTGVFNVMYTGGVNVNVAKNNETNDTQLAVAAVEDNETYVETQDENTRDKKKTRQNERWYPVNWNFEEGDYRKLHQRSFLTGTPGPGNETVLDEGLFFDVARILGRDVTQHDFDKGSLLAGNLSGFLGDAVGAATFYVEGNGETDTGFRIVAIDDDAGENHIQGSRALRIWNPTSGQWDEMGIIQSELCFNGGVLQTGKGGFVTAPYTLDGLGRLGTTLYASGVNRMGCGMNSTGNVGVYELTPPEEGSNYVPVQRMSFPSLELGGGLAGANNRGTMFYTARFNDGRGDDLVLLEIDPRTNYIANAWSSAFGDFNVGDNSDVNTTDKGVPNNFASTGVAYSQGRVVVTGRAGESPVLMGFNPDNQPRQTGHSSVTHMRFGTGTGAFHTEALAGDGGRNAAASVHLDQPERPFTGYLGIDPLWLNTAYSRDASLGQTLHRMVGSTVLSLARDPVACAASAEYATRLPQAIKNHSGQMSGVGQALREFHQTIPQNSPCGLPVAD